jgi:dTDP-4-amino-4,6-dideoxygalactose transaminase
LSAAPPVSSASRRIPWIDLRPQTAEVEEEVWARWREIAVRGDFSSGGETALFEQEWAAYCGTAHAVGCSDGTLALVLALRACGVDAGDEVITAPTSFFATAEAIALARARPAFADVDERTGNLDPERVSAAIGDRTRAIVAVHLAGRPAPMDQLRDLATSRGLRLIEDAAQAQGATHRGRKAGSLGDAAGFSFYPTKNLGAFGEAGAVTTSDPSVAAAARALRDHGQPSRHRHESIGYNSRLDSVQAAVLRCKLKRLDRWNAERRTLAARYRSALNGLPLGLPPEDPEPGSVYHIFTIRTPQRDGLARRLSEVGIGTGSHYPVPIHLQPVFAHLGYRRGDFPNAERYAAEQLSLPLYPGLSAEDVDRVAEAIRAFFRNGRAV